MARGSKKGRVKENKTRPKGENDRETVLTGTGNMLAGRGLGEEGARRRVELGSLLVGGTTANEKSEKRGFSARFFLLLLLKGSAICFLIRGIVLLLRVILFLVAR
jgi:hypothetical protein